MIREVDFVDYYLPPFMQECKEPVAALKAEEPEFQIVWKAVDRTLYNHFISTADEYGISRYEKMLGIYPSTEDTLEDRRSRVQNRWFNTIPYTWRMFLQKLVALCGENNFTVTRQFDYYLITLQVQLELSWQVEELERIIKTMFPCNMAIDARNNIPIEVEGVALVSGGICMIENFLITNDWKARNTVGGSALVKNRMVMAEHIEII